MTNRYLIEAVVHWTNAGVAFIAKFCIFIAFLVSHTRFTRVLASADVLRQPPILPDTSVTRCDTERERDGVRGLACSHVSLPMSSKGIRRFTLKTLKELHEVCRVGEAQSCSCRACTVIREGEQPSCLCCHAAIDNGLRCVTICDFAYAAERSVRTLQTAGVPTGVTSHVIELFKERKKCVEQRVALTVVDSAF